MASVLVIGSNAREQALAWKLAQSRTVNKVFVAPGNAGSKGKVENVSLDADDVDGLKQFAEAEQIDLTVIGPEASAAAGLADSFKAAGLVVFGPTKEAVRIETSKAFSKELMQKSQIPTAKFKSFSNAKAALNYAISRPLPVVVKADGLAGGKGVIIARTKTEAKQAIDQIMVNKSFGVAGNEVVLEEFLFGQEISMHALSDGQRSVMFPPSQDHKQVYDKDEGPNTGGMGAYAPVSWLDQTAVEAVKDQVVSPALKALKARDIPFQGCLYPGLMINGSDIKVLEYNARFGDPEAEVYMRLFDGDLFQVLKSCAEGRLNADEVKWKPGFAVSVVIASAGYPGNYPKGLPISGLEAVEKMTDIIVFHAGTAIKDGRLVTSGGRVLNVTATGSTLDEAINKAYAAVKLIHFDGMHYRSDIGKRPSQAILE